MKFMLSLLALGYVALASSAPSLPVNPGGIGGLFKGPNSETIIKGPDGSVITAAAVGGAVQTELEPIVVAEPAAVAVAEPAAVAVAAPAIAPAPVVETVVVPAPVVETKQSSDLIGPSGRIATEGSQAVIAGPASTTISGPAVVAETIVKGPPIIGTPILNAAAPVAAVTAAPTITLGSTLAPITATNLAPLSLSPVAPLTADIAPISVTASPGNALGSLYPSSVPVTPRAELAPTIVTAGVPSIATVTATPPVAIVTPSPQAVATASASPHLSVASVSSNQGAIATASISPNRASAAVETSAVTPTLTSGGPGLVGINDRIDITSQLIPDQLAIDNRQLNINPAAIPSANIIPPEIVVTPKTISDRFRPTPGTLLTTPGLGAVAGPIPRLRPTPGPFLTTPGLGTVASSTNIQREEGDATLNVTPNIAQLQSQVGLTQQQLLALQNQQTLLNSQIQQAEQADSTGLVATNQRIIQSQSRDGGTGARLVATNQQLIQSQARDGTLLASTVQPGLLSAGGDISLADVQQQQILSAQLAKSGIDASQLQLTNVPLSSVTTLDLQNGVKGAGINNGLTADAWGRYGRDAENQKKVTKKKKD